MNKINDSLEEIVASRIKFFFFFGKKKLKGKAAVFWLVSTDRPILQPIYFTFTNPLSFTLWSHNYYGFFLFD